MPEKIKLLLARIVNSNDTLKYYCVRVWNALGRIRYRRKYAGRYKVKERLVLFESFGGRQYSCNPRALYEALRDDPKYRGYRKIWAFQDPEKYRFLEEDPATKVVQFRSPLYYRVCASAKIWVSNFRMRNELVPKKEQIYIQTWHGTPLKRLGFDINSDSDAGGQHGQEHDHSADAARHSYMSGGQRELEYEYATDARRYSYMLAPSEFYREKLSSAFRLDEYAPQCQFINGGYPRNDFLLRLTEEQISQLRGRLDIPEGKKVILYAPTWRETLHVPGAGYRYYLAVDFAKWREALGPDVLILYRSHYLVGNSIDLSAYEGFVRNVSDYDDINDLYAVSDLLITDYSSVFFDYANLERPIYFFMYDYEQYKYEMRGFYIDEQELPGPIIRREDELLDALAGDYWEKYAERYAQFNQKYNPYRKGDGSSTVWKTVLGRRG